TFEEHIDHLHQVLQVLKENQLVLNEKKCEFSQQSLVFLGHVVGDGELRIDPTKIEAIQNWPTPSSLTETRSFVGAVQYLRKFIKNFSSIAVHLHSVTTRGKDFDWGKKQHIAFESFKYKISHAPVLALPNLQLPFEVETDVSDYVMGVVLLQGGRPICYHSELFHGAILNYCTYDKELYALVQVVKKWKHYLMGKETIIHMDHQPLQYLQAQNKLQQARHYKWMGFPQQFHLIIKYKKGVTNKLADMLSRPPFLSAMGTLTLLEPFLCEAYQEGYEQDPNFAEIFQQKPPSEGFAPRGEYYFQDGFLYKNEKLCVPKGERVQLMREAHTSKVVGHFGVTKTVAHLQ
ncbi:hypothetical protein KI387_043172, partial [Taxus chinensis]